jgi:ketol-acid reductoisomerase
MTTMFHEADADRSVLRGKQVAVVGYGNQGRSWALNLRDSGLDVTVCVRADETRDRARSDGFDAAPIEAASEADVICVLVPDDVIPSLGLRARSDACTIVASGYTLAFDRFAPAGDVVMVAPRMLGPDVRVCYEEGTGFITAVGVHRDSTGQARSTMLAVADAIGGLRQGAIEMTALQEAVLDLAVEQVLSPALTQVTTAFVTAMSEQGIPFEAIMCELVLSGEVERTYGRLREEGFAAQMEHHSPTSQYGQLSRRGQFDELDTLAHMRRLTEDITSGRFAEEWDAECDTGHPRLSQLKEQHCGAAIRALDAELRSKLGSAAGGQ